MFKALTPFGLAQWLQTLMVEHLPALAVPILFVVLLALYLRFLVKLLLQLWCYADFRVAMLIRQYGSTPPDVQHWLADGLQQLPRLLTRASLLVIAGTLAWTWLEYGDRPDPGTALDQFRRGWRGLVQFLWG